MRSSNAPFDEKGFAEVIRDLERHELLLNSGGDTDPNSGTNLGYDEAPSSQQSGGDGSGSTVAQQIAAHEAKVDPHPQYALASEVVTPAQYNADKTVGALASAGFWTAITGWSTVATVPAGTLTGFDTTTGVFTPPSNGVYSFCFTLVGAPASLASYLGLGIFGTHAYAQDTNLSTNGPGLSQSISQKLTVYCYTSQSIYFSWGSPVNWTGAGFTLNITKVS